MSRPSLNRILAAVIMPSMSELVRLWPRRRFWALPVLASIRYSHSTSSASFPVEVDEPTKPRGKWLTLPPFAPSVDAASLGKELYGRRPAAEAEPTTVLKWVRHCCPHLPMSLLQKLFRLRQVRKNQITVEKSCCNDATDAEQGRLRRVSAKDAMMPGEVIFLPVTVEEFTTERSEKFKYNDVEISFVRDLELYKDEAIIVINKPPGIPTQGGVGIRYSMDGLAANCLKYDFSEPPRLVHRLDRDSSGVLVLGRTQTSTSILHSLFREKTSGALTEDMTQRTLQRKYLALVIGTPRHPRGLISAPLAKIILEDGKSERIIIADDDKSPSAQHALTEYKVIRTSTHGYTWLELFPLTGRKHQLRVHCADILRTPIVGDYKYGRHAHRKYEPMRSLEPTAKCEEIFKQNFPFGLQLDGGSITEKSLRLHLHCKQMTLPNISVALQQLQLSEDYDLSKLEKLTLVAPLPPHMQTSWKILTSMS